MNTDNTVAQNNKATSPKYNRPHLIIPESDWKWIDGQQGYVATLWRECWKIDRYGSRWVELQSTLSKNRFLSARKILVEAGLFEFKSEKLSSDGRKTDKWFVRNLHGARVDSFWKGSIDDIFHQKIKLKRKYARFLKSDYWKLVRRQVLQRDNHICQQCKSSDELHVHHKTYRNHRNEHNNLSDLITLCKRCHASMHGK